MAFSAGGDGGRKAPEIPTQTARRPSLVSDCPTIAIYVFALVQRAVGIALSSAGTFEIALAVQAAALGLGVLAGTNGVEQLRQPQPQLIALVLGLDQLLAQGVAFGDHGGELLAVCCQVRACVRQEQIKPILPLFLQSSVKPKYSTSASNTISAAAKSISVRPAAWKPVYTRNQITKIYDQHRRGAYAGREAEWARQEADIIAAGREGRIQGPDYLTK